LIIENTEFVLKLTDMAKSCSFSVILPMLGAIIVCQGSLIERIPRVLTRGQTGKFENLRFS